MILPKEIKGQNKIRDSRILSVYATGQADYGLISKQFKISQERVSQIVRANASVLLQYADYLKVKRIRFLNGILGDESIPLANTRIEAVRELRKEFEGDSERGNQTLVQVSVSLPSTEISSAPTLNNTIETPAIEA